MMYILKRHKHLRDKTLFELQTAWYEWYTKLECLMTTIMSHDDDNVDKIKWKQGNHDDNEEQNIHSPEKKHHK